MKTTRLPLVALVGRPNVGKSTFFNQFARGQKSIVNEEAGTTRDRMYANVSAAGLMWQLVDTGGIDFGLGHDFYEVIRKQSQVAIAEADIVVFLLDASTGILPADEDVAAVLRKSKKKVILAVNKAESQRLKDSIGDFYTLGFNEVIAVSAAHRQNLEQVFLAASEYLSASLKASAKAAFDAIEPFTKKRRKKAADLSDEVAEDSAKESEDNKAPESKAPSVYKVAVIGKPNAGKSSFINKLLGEERLLTSPIAGTTMDAVDTPFEYAGTQFLLIDTAGIRRKRSIGRDLEKQAVSRALAAMDKADIALLLIDAISGVTEQDMKVAAFAHDKGKALVIVVNKWDLGKKEGFDADIYAKQVRSKMPFVAYAPIRFVSATTGTRVFDVLETIQDVAGEYFKRISTSKVNALLKKALAEHQLPMVSGRRVKLYFGSQVAVAPPTFVFSCNDADGVHFSYQRFLQNQIRESFGFKGTPLKLFFREKEPQKT